MKKKLMKKSKKVPKSMFGVDKEGKSYTSKEHDDFQMDTHYT